MPQRAILELLKPSYPALLISVKFVPNRCLTSSCISNRLRSLHHLHIAWVHNRTEIFTEDFCLLHTAINSLIISRWKEPPYKWSFFFYFLNICKTYLVSLALPAMDFLVMSFTSHIDFLHFITSGSYKLLSSSLFQFFIYCFFSSNCCLAFATEPGWADGQGWPLWVVWQWLLAR